MPRALAFDKDAAIEIAMDEIWRNGYEASSVKHLSETLGITRSSFYNAFESREALFEQVLQKYAGDAPTSMLLDITPETPVKPAITKIMRALCKVRAKDHDRRGCMVANCMAELLPSDEKAGKIVKGMAIQGLQKYEEVIGWAVERGELPKKTDAKGLALALHSLMIGLNTQSKVVHNEKDLWNSASTTLKALGLYAA